MYVCNYICLYMSIQHTIDVMYTMLCRFNPFLIHTTRCLNMSGQYCVHAQYTLDTYRNIIGVDYTVKVKVRSYHGIVIIH